jgi:hypothetical protein
VVSTAIRLAKRDGVDGSAPQLRGNWTLLP